MNNTALIIACTASVAGCLGAAYLVDKINPVPPIRDRDILETTSIAGVTTLTKSAVAPLVQNSEDPKEIFNLYLAKTITLEDALEMLLKKGNDVGIKDLYTSVVSKRDGLPEDSDERAYYDTFKKALEKYYPGVRPGPSAPPTEDERPRLPPTAPPVQYLAPPPLPPTAPPVEDTGSYEQERDLAYLGWGPAGRQSTPPPKKDEGPDEQEREFHYRLRGEEMRMERERNAASRGGRRHGTQKHRHPVVRSILCADA